MTVTTESFSISLEPARTSSSRAVVQANHPDSPETLLVLYLGSEEMVVQICERLGAKPVEPANPYWQQHGVTIVDPDGFRVVLVPDWWPAA